MTQSVEDVVIAFATETTRVGAKMRGDIDGKRATVYNKDAFKMSCLGAMIGFFCVLFLVMSPVLLGIGAKMYDRYDH